MNNDYTHFSTSEFSELVRKSIKQEKLHRPKESCIEFLKKFARNYRVNMSMPDGLQGFMLS